MDQPFESDVMEDLAMEIPVSSADEALDGYDADYDAAYDAEEGFEDSHAFSDEMDGFENDAFSDNLSADLWDDNASSDEFSPPSRSPRNSNSRQNQHYQNASSNGFENGFEDSFEDSFEDGFEDGFEDSFASGDEFAEDASVDAIDSMEAAIADALEAEDSDEFFRRVVQGVRRAANVARQVGRGVGQAARAVAPIARAIPLPQAQAIARVANIAGRLLANGADEFAALDEMLSFAETEEAVDAAAPIIAGLTIRTIMPRTSRLNPALRRQLVRSVRQSTQALARRQGTPAIRAIPRVVQAVQRTAQRRRISPRQLPQAVRRATANVVRNPRLVSQLARATRQATAVTQSYGRGSHPGMPQRLVIRGPVEITIRNR
jgi:hypothetical protein